MLHMLVTALVQAVEQELIKAAPAVQQMIASQIQYLAESTYKYMTSPGVCGSADDVEESEEKK